MAMEIGLMICLDSLEDKNFKFYLRCGIAGFRTVFLCADPRSGIMPLARRTGRAASRRKSISARFEKADPCSGIMPLTRRTGRAPSASKEK